MGNLLGLVFVVIGGFIAFMEFDKASRFGVAPQGLALFLTFSIILVGLIILLKPSK